ncbi:MAG TPA: hypothetical protein VOA87_02740 [Thermoanaerobaculia bacterium]|nr:hypothetical protein [Thermoanaerobaculia bacterium]
MVLEPTLQEDTHPLGPRAEAGALFRPEPERTPLTLPPERPSGRSRVHRVRLAAAERQFLSALFVALALAAGALLLASASPAFGSVSRGDAVLAAAVVASGLLMLVLGHFCRHR